MSKVACFVFLSMLLVIRVAGQSGPSSQPTVWATKPDAAAFEKIVNDRLAAGQKSIDKIVAVKGTRTIENTLVPYDEAIRQVNIGNYLANMMFQVHPDAAFRDKASTAAGEGCRLDCSIGATARAATTFARPMAKSARDHLGPAWRVGGGTGG